jgi:hypothetical protein
MRSKSLVLSEAGNIESARAVVFLLDAQGKVQCQPMMRRVIGGGNSNGLAAGATNAFHFVVTGPDPSGFATTNLTAQVQFTRLTLEGGKVADPAGSVEIFREASP